jgi:hypothetical protein
MSSGQACLNPIAREIHGECHCNPEKIVFITA